MASPGALLSCLGRTARISPFIEALPPYSRLYSQAAKGCVGSGRTYAASESVLSGIALHRSATRGRRWLLNSRPAEQSVCPPAQRRSDRARRIERPYGSRQMYCGAFHLARAGWLSMKKQPGTPWLPQQQGLGRAEYLTERRSQAAPYEHTGHKCPVARYSTSDGQPAVLSMMARSLRRRPARRSSIDQRRAWTAAPTSAE